MRAPCCHQAADGQAVRRSRRRHLRAGPLTGSRCNHGGAAIDLRGAGLTTPVALFWATLTPYLFFGEVAEELATAPGSPVEGASEARRLTPHRLTHPACQIRGMHRCVTKTSSWVMACMSGAGGAESRSALRLSGKMSSAMSAGTVKTRAIAWMCETVPTVADLASPFRHGTIASPGETKADVSPLSRAGISLNDRGARRFWQGGSRHQTGAVTLSIALARPGTNRSRLRTANLFASISTPEGSEAGVPLTARQVLGVAIAPGWSMSGLRSRVLEPRELTDVS